MLTKGVFTISIDYEFAWGYADHELTELDKERIRKEVDITRRLLDLFKKYDIPATWAITSHLLEHGCQFDGETPHPEYPRPIHQGEKRDWFALHPKEREYTDQLWFDAENVIAEIKQSNERHELGSHAYAHISYGKDTNEEVVKADLKNIGKIHRVHDLPYTSFVFPRNVEGHHRLLKINGFTAYRGNSEKWYDDKEGLLKRAAHFIDYFLPKGRVVDVDTSKFGLVNIPDSMLLLARNGIRSLIPPFIMQRKALKGLHQAIKKNKVFHLWFHPSNFSYNTDTQFKIFENILAKAANMRGMGDIDIKTMDEIGEPFKAHIEI